MVRRPNSVRKPPSYKAGFFVSGHSEAKRPPSSPLVVRRHFKGRYVAAFARCAARRPQMQIFDKLADADSLLVPNQPVF